MQPLLNVSTEKVSSSSGLQDTICSRDNPKQCTFLTSCDPCSLQMVSHGLGQTQSHRKETLEEILRPWCRSIMPLGKVSFHYVQPFPILPWNKNPASRFLMEVHLTIERGICRKPVGKEGCSQMQWECTWHVGTWDNSELDPSTTWGFSPMHIHCTWKKVNRACNQSNPPAKMTATKGNIWIKN